jgi:iron(III) transport system permease protein
VANSPVTTARPARGLVALCGALGVVFALPLLYLGWRSAVDGFDVGGALAGPIGRSVVLALSVGVASTVLGVGLAVAVARTNVWGARWWRVVVVLPLVIPSYVGASAWRAAFAPGGLVGDGAVPVAGFWAAFSVLTLLSYPLVTLPVAARLRSLPSSMDEAGQMLGAGGGRIFRKVTLPQVGPLAGSGGLLVFLYTLSDFGAVSLLRYDVITQSIYATRLFNPERATTLSLALAVIALVVVVAQERWSRRVHLAPGQPNAGRRVHLGLHAKAAVTAALCTVSAMALVAPLGTLAYWAFRRGDLEIGYLAEPAANTAVTGVVTALVVMAMVLPIAFLVQKYRSRFNPTINAMVLVGFALPGIVIALALVSMSVQLPEWTGLYQSFPILVLAYAIHFGSQGLGSAKSAVGTVSRRLPEAASLLGAGATRRFTKVYLPLMMPGLLAGGGLVLLATLKELPATLLLAPIGFETIATRIWGANEDGFLAEVGLQSLVLVAVSGVLTWILVLRRMDKLA